MDKEAEEFVADKIKENITTVPVLYNSQLMILPVTDHRYNDEDIVLLKNRNRSGLIEIFNASKNDFKVSTISEFESDWIYLTNNGDKALYSENNNIIINNTFDNNRKSFNVTGKSTLGLINEERDRAVIISNTDETYITVFNLNS